MKNDICFSFVSVHPKVKLEIGYSFFPYKLELGYMERAITANVLVTT